MVSSEKASAWTTGAYARPVTKQGRREVRYAYGGGVRPPLGSVTERTAERSQIRDAPLSRDAINVARRADNCIIRESAPTGLPPSGFTIAYTDRLTSHGRLPVTLNRATVCTPPVQRGRSFVP